MKVSEIRTIHVCVICEDVGSTDPDVAERIKIDPLLVLEVHRDAAGRARWRRTAHAKCLGLEGVLLLPQEELRKVRMSDFGAEGMKLVLAAFDQRRRGRR